MSGLRRRLDRLEGQSRTEYEDEAERQKRLEGVRRAAERENERFFRYLAIERRAAFLDCVGYDGHAPGSLRDENFLYPDDEPPFTITEDGVFASRDSKRITGFHQTLAEVWYWQAVEEGEPNLVHDQEAQAFYTPTGELALSRDVADLRYLMGPTRDYGRRGEG
jgi:hypothetical protein